MKVSEEKIQEHLSWRCFWRALFFVPQGADSYNFVKILHSSQSTMSMLMHSTLKRLRISRFEIAWHCQSVRFTPMASIAHTRCAFSIGFSQGFQRPKITPVSCPWGMWNISVAWRSLAVAWGTISKKPIIWGWWLWKSRKVKGIPLEKRPDVRDKMFLVYFSFVFVPLFFWVGLSSSRLLCSDNMWRQQEPSYFCLDRCNWYDMFPLSHANTL